MSRLVRARAIAAVCVVAAIGLQVAVVAGSATGVAGPPPTPVPPRGSLSPFPSTLATPADAIPPPAIDARAALLADLDTGQILQAQHAADLRPIASVTKIMTALLILERTHLDDVVTVDPRAVFDRGDYGADSTLGLRAGERLTVRDLLYGMLLGSANDAAAALAIAEAGSQTAFVAQMNARARTLGMRHTRFFSVHGLDDRGHSTAVDLLRLVRAADRTPMFDGSPPRVSTRSPRRTGVPVTSRTATRCCGSTRVRSERRRARRPVRARASWRPRRATAVGWSRSCSALRMRPSPTPRRC